MISVIFANLLLAQVNSASQPAPEFTPAERAAIMEKAVRDAAQKPTVSDVLYRGLNKLQGKAQRVAFKVLGYPDGKMQIGNEIVYRWVNTTSNLDGGALTCTVKIVVSRGFVVSTDFNGNNGACETYARSVDPSFDGLP